MTGYPERYIVFDTETLEKRAERPGWHKQQWLRLGIAKIYDPIAVVGNKPLYHGFTTQKEFFDMVDAMPCNKLPIYVFAHNFGFDIRIVDWLRALKTGDYLILPPPHAHMAGRYTKPLFVVDGYPFMLRLWRRDGQQLLLIDSYNWLPGKLAEVGDWVGMPKGDLPARDATEHDWWAYCQRDVDVLDRALRRLWGFMQTLRVPNFSYTPAGSAAQVYRMRYAKKRIIKPADPAILKLDRLGYYGGRIDAFRLGYIEGLTHQYDVNSLYPRVMLDHVYPCEVLDHGDAQGAVVAQVRDHAAECTAEVCLESPEVAWPCRGRDGSLWVRGHVRTVLCGPELRWAVQGGFVRHIHRWVRYRCDDLFSGYVRYFWRQRAQAQARGDTLTDKVCKAYLNSLHGKFGQRDGQWRYAGKSSVESLYGSGRVIADDLAGDCDYRLLNGDLFYRERDEEHDQAFVPIAAWTASYGRMFMYDLMKDIGDAHCHYLCYDSLLVDPEGRRRLEAKGWIDPDALGQLKHEATYQWIDIQAHHQIDHDLGWKHSGIKRGAQPLGDDVYEWEEWSQCAGDIFAGYISSVSTRMVQRKPSRDYWQRFVGPERRTIPWAIANWKVPAEVMRQQSVLSYRHGAK